MIRSSVLSKAFSQYDTQVSQPTLADETRNRQETESCCKTEERTTAAETAGSCAGFTDHHPRARAELPEEDFARAHEVPFLNASNTVF